MDHKGTVTDLNYHFMAFIKKKTDGNLKKIVITHLIICKDTLTFTLQNT